MSLKDFFVRRASLRWKVTAALLVTGWFGVFASGSAIFLYEVSSTRSSAIKELNTLAEILAMNNTGALAFEDALSAERTLETLQDDQEILAARIFTDEGVPLASYTRPHHEVRVAEQPLDVAPFQTEQRLHVFRPVHLKGERLGTIYLQSDLTVRQARLERYAAIACLAMGILFLAVLLLSIPLQRMLSEPILHLARVAKGVAAKKDFSVRVPHLGQDEIGVLSNTFNEMLETLAERDSALQNANHILQAEVNQRRQTEAALQQSRQRLELAQQVGNVGTFEWDVRTGRLKWTDELASLYGIRLENFAGTYDAWLRLVHPDDLEPLVREQAAVMGEDRDFSSEFRIVRPDGAVRWIAARSRLFRDVEGQPDRVIGINMDITDRKEAEQKLTQQAEELWRSNRELEQFAYVSSHDLKEPLRKIASYTQLLEQRFSGSLDTEGKRYMAHILNGVDRMQSLIHDLLVYSRTGKEEIKFELVDMKRILQQTLGDLETAIHENGAIVTSDPMPALRAQPAQMHQLLQNLLSNAIKFHGTVTPRVHVSARRDGEEWIFGVKDNGIGIDSRYQDQIFKIFQRLHNRTEYPGTGIGLAICKKIVERHGGRIWVESTPGEGATFLFSLPEHQPAEARAESVGAAPRA